ncbi:MAG: 2-oxo-4-hydroxy-4-carboxy-5-ureidoimidazoline decarboxylase [Propionibacteriales bacterium]|nr:2-oxo-4-hydroxy-4-carboxy-5-ureidoimidazoline decarboxylase [Propionibacteriales bacterium]
MSHLTELAAELDARLADADAALAARYPGDPVGRRPVHTVYVPADRFHADVVAEWGRRAREALDLHGGTAAELAEVFGLDERLVSEVHERVRRKLEHEPIEDLRIDFEDGYGVRPDAEEDHAATDAARALATAAASGEAPPFCGIRIKGLEAPTRARGLRTLDRFTGELAAHGGLPGGFTVTLPKVSSVEQVEAMVHVCERLERAHGLADGRLRFEIQVETPQAVVGADGTALVARMIHAAQGRCDGLHFGTYDYTEACGVAGPYQSMEHPAADHAKAVMQVAAAGTGVRLSDGSTNVLPVGDRNDVRSAWRLHGRLVRRSLERGFYQGWDLHPGQLPSRFLATYAFYRERLPAAAQRLRAYSDQPSADEPPGLLDEPATVAALRGFLARGIACGALDPDEVDPGLAEFNSLPEADLRSRLLACCDVESWADALLMGRPYATRDDPVERADEAARSWTADEVERALAAHPRIGERAGGDGRTARWSRAEQSGVSRDMSTAEALATANREYEARFGHVFLICASGLGAGEILESLRLRLTHGPETEARVVADELRKIALLRLKKVLDP